MNCKIKYYLVLSQFLTILFSSCESQKHVRYRTQSHVDYANIKVNLLKLIEINSNTKYNDGTGIMLSINDVLLIASENGCDDVYLLRKATRDHLVDPSHDLFAIVRMRDGSLRGLLVPQSIFIDEDFLKTIKHKYRYYDLK